MKPVTLTDGTVVLSVPTPADLDPITAACQDPEVAAWVTVPSPYERSHAEAFLTHTVQPGWQSGTELTWAIRSADGDLLGMIGLHGVADGSAEVGFWVAPWARQRGVLGRALQLVLTYAFDDPEGLGLQRVVWKAFVGNWPSRRAAWRAGFRVEGTLRLDSVQRGQRRDSWVGTILRGDERTPAEAWPQDAPAAPATAGAQQAAPHARMEP